MQHPLTEDPINARNMLAPVPTGRRRCHPQWHSADPWADQCLHGCDRGADARPWISQANKQPA